ncbi:MAG: lyase family protein, partial [Chloroflexota bacterium]|nr:lyase family protein [Chloroflexota bacterium]
MQAVTYNRSVIDRYTLPEMGALWSDARKYEQWLRVELAVCEAWTEAGVIPPADMERLRKATVSAERVSELERETDHDLIAFVRAAGETIGPERRWLHLGLTSSDVVDTALSLTLVEAGDLLLSQLCELERVITRLAEEYRNTPTIGRTHGVHAEPTTFGLKLAGWAFELDRARERLARALQGLAVGKLSGAV